MKLTKLLNQSRIPIKVTLNKERSNYENNQPKVTARRPKNGWINTINTVIIVLQWLKVKRLSYKISWIMVIVRFISTERNGHTIKAIKPLTPVRAVVLNAKVSSWIPKRVCHSPSVIVLAIWLKLVQSLQRLRRNFPNSQKRIHATSEMRINS